MNFDYGIWVLGAGGIGLALAKKIRQLAIEVTVISRPEYNLTQAKDVKRLFDQVETLPSVIVNTIGMLYDDQHTPEKSLSTFSADWFYESLRVNAMPAMWIAQCLTEKLSKQQQLIFINPFLHAFLV